MSRKTYRVFRTAVRRAFRENPAGTKLLRRFNKHTPDSRRVPDSDICAAASLRQQAILQYAKRLGLDLRVRRKEQA